MNEQKKDFGNEKKEVEIKESKEELFGRIQHQQRQIEALRVELNRQHELIHRLKKVMGDDNFRNMITL